jgi:hypothetical protein
METEMDLTLEDIKHADYIIRAHLLGDRAAREELDKLIAAARAHLEGQRPEPVFKYDAIARACFPETDFPGDPQPPQQREDDWPGKPCFMGSDETPAPSSTVEPEKDALYALARDCFPETDMPWDNPFPDAGLVDHLEAFGGRSDIPPALRELIENAVRALEAKDAEIDGLFIDLAKAQAEIERLRGALELIANPKATRLYRPIDTARAALRGGDG